MYVALITRIKKYLSILIILSIRCNCCRYISSKIYFFLVISNNLNSDFFISRECIEHFKIKEDFYMENQHYCVNHDFRFQVPLDMHKEKQCSAAE